ncbi:sporulation membrane protein YtrI [Metabacillus herbersteinensis]|uniref:Sporulation membrane protein YtrI n=1 Tax=Metabacillus herbersteinensis TaxID=283816 RepID=A0ABV6G9D5_9BACI
MRIPPYYRLPTWQRFFAGMIIGAIVSWCVFLFIFGILQEDQVKTIQKQKDIIQVLENQNKIWREDVDLLNKKNEEKLTVKDIRVKLMNGERFHFNTLMTYNVEKRVKDDLSDVIAKDIESVYSNRKLIKKAIENTIYKMDAKEYKVKVTEFVLFTTIYIEIEVAFAK